MDGTQWLAQALAAARMRLDVATNNLANVASDGFAKVYARVTAARDGLHVGTARDRLQGPLVHTGEPFDLAIAGPGALTVRALDGAGVERTRAGHFTPDARGLLSDSRGRLLLDRAGRPIAVTARTAIDAAGTISEGGTVVTRLEVAPGARLAPGFLERPGVDAIGEMVEVLDAQRTFETAQKVLATLDDARAKAAADVARLK